MSHFSIEFYSCWETIVDCSWFFSTNKVRMHYSQYAGKMGSGFGYLFCYLRLIDHLLFWWITSRTDFYFFALEPSYKSSYNVERTSSSVVYNTESLIFLKYWIGDDLNSRKLIHLFCGCIFVRFKIFLPYKTSSIAVLILPFVYV